MTLYDILELSPNCSFDDIKHQYRTLAKLHHPDLGGDEEKFKRIKFAYEILSDPDRRKQYDETKSTDQPIDLRKESIDQLASIFFSIIPNFNCKEGNLIDALKLEITNMRNRANGDTLMNEMFISNLEIVKDKLKIKNNNKEDIILSFVEAHLQTRYSDRKLFEKRLEMVDIMLEILDNYNYGFLELLNDIPVISE